MGQVSSKPRGSKGSGFNARDGILTFSLSESGPLYLRTKWCSRAVTFPAMRVFLHAVQAIVTPRSSTSGVLPIRSEAQNRM
eukprot:3104001-Amphidinium_carterae.2